MLPRWQGGVATIVVTALAVALVVLDLVDAGVRHFWATHTLTTDFAGGLLVLALTVLVVDQVVSRRQLADRSRAVAANAGIVLAQASRSVRAATATGDDRSEQLSAPDELRAYLQILLVGAPVLIEDPVARRFLERAQRLGGELARLVLPTGAAAATSKGPAAALDKAVADLRAAAQPLLAVLTTDERALITDDAD